MTAARNGLCLCGACRFTATPEHGAHACHCGNCRTWSGGMFPAVLCGTPAVFNQNAPLARYGSSERAERVFCARCGSSAVWQMKDGSRQIVSIQAFESPGDFVIDSQIYVDRKPGSYAPANRTEMLTEAGVSARYAIAGQGGA